jgi:hypothetical protein
MILESRGTPDILKEIISENIDTIKEIISKSVNSSINLDINKSIVLSDRKVSLKCNLVIMFNFDVKYNYTGDINYLSIINSNFKSCIINVFLPILSTIGNTLSALSHELLHLYELYQIRKIFDKTRWKDTTTLIDLGKFDIIMKYGTIKYFKDLFYLSLPHEINARVASLHFYLLSFRINDKVFLLKKLEDTIVWIYLLMLKDFDL